jgi:hypothetical protein
MTLYASLADDAVENIDRDELVQLTTPRADPLALRDEIEEALRTAGIPPTGVELYAYHRGFEAERVERLHDAVVAAHRAVIGSEPPPPNPAPSSMWRNINIWNELGVPALTYGPRAATHSVRRAFPIK